MDLLVGTRLGSRTLEFASALVDGIGPRLTGSPNLKRANEWTRSQLATMGCANATPWSSSTNGVVNGTAIWMDINSEKDFEQYKGKLAGKVVLLGDMREVKLADKPLFVRSDDRDLSKIARYPLVREHESDQYVQTVMQQIDLAKKTGEFLAAEHAIAVVRPSRDGKDGGGSGGTIFVDRGLVRTEWPMALYKRENALPLPVVVMAIENYGRVYRLLKAKVPVNNRAERRYEDYR